MEKGSSILELSGTKKGFLADREKGSKVGVCPLGCSGGRKKVDSSAPFGGASMWSGRGTVRN